MAARSTITVEEFEEFNEQLRQLLQSGVPLTDGLARVAAEIGRPSLREAMTRVASSLRRGQSLTEALEREGGIFPLEYRGLVKAGEASGNLLGALETALDHERYLAQLEEGLKRATFYPLVVVGWTLLVFAFFMIFGYPMYGRLFTIAGEPMPWSLRAAGWLFYGPQGFFTVGWLALLLAGGYWVKSRWGLGTLALKVPVLKAVVAQVYSGRLARTLGLLLNAGVKTDAALGLIADATSDPTMRARLARASREVAEGDSLSQAVGAIGLEDTGLPDLVALGEEAGTLPALLIAAADLYRVEAQAELDLILRATGVVLLLAAGAWVVVLLGSLFSTYVLLPGLSL